MAEYNYLVASLAWIIGAIGAVGILTGFIKFYEGLHGGTGTEKRDGTLTALGGIALIAIAASVANLIPPPPTF